MMREWGRAKRQRNKLLRLIARILTEIKRHAKRQEGKLPIGAPKAMQLFNDLLNLRNDLAHCAMRRDPRPANSAITQVKEIVNGLDDCIHNL